jgi:hypothetical protein
MTSPTSNTDTTGPSATWAKVVIGEVGVVVLEVGTGSVVVAVMGMPTVVSANGPDAVLRQPAKATIDRTGSIKRISTCLTPSSSQTHSPVPGITQRENVVRSSVVPLPITIREMPATPTVFGSHRYTPVASDITAKLRILGGVVGAGYAHPVRIEVENGQNHHTIRIPDRQLQIMIGLTLVVALARLIERKGRT